MTYTKASLKAALLSLGFAEVFISRDMCDVQALRNGAWMKLGHFGQAVQYVESAR